MELSVIILRNRFWNFHGFFFKKNYIFPEPIKLWRSRFQYHKPVHRHGSEAVQNYFAPVFPPVPSAAGSIISREIANYLTHNKNHFLHGFASIAHALAIWLAPIAPSYYDEMDWFNNFNEAVNNSKCKNYNF